MRAYFNSVRSRRSTYAFAIGVFVVIISGCGGGGLEDKFKGERGSVSGKVTYKGAAVPAGSTVVFASEEGGFSAIGAVKANGEYSLSYHGKNVMPAVKYIVAVSPAPAPAAKPAAPVDPAKAGGDFDPSKLTSDAAMAAAGKEKMVQPTLPFPAKYTDAAKSGLSFFVKAGANKADFDLTD